MNPWKPIALCLAVGLVASVGIQTASADKNPEPPSTLTGGPCDGQGHMAAAVSLLSQANQQLQAALPDKGGKRVEAMGQITNTISTVQAGCRAGGSN
ncbi:MAG TPA: hypothetical protein VGL81_35335 [Polyangiaceae bacterium]|jgi:hypothetical protein